jgi:4-phytase/acid phosphatase
MVADRLKTVVRRTNPGMLSVIVLGAFIFEASAAEYALDRVVLVSRHGVRAPTDSPAIAEFSRSLSWPKWPVKDAFLTQRGKLLATRMGEFYAAEYGSQGLLPAGHLNEKQVYVWADVDQRTRETGAGLLEGIFGCQDGCPLPGNDYGDNDALFHPVKGKVCNIDPATAQAEIIKQAGGSLDKALEPYRDAILPELQKVLDCCQPKICKPLSSCTLDTMQSLLEGVSLKGPIAVGSTASEVFLLEYGQGMQAKDVMWGHGSSARINAFLGLHDLQFKLLQRTRYIAKRQGAALGRQILETLRETAEKKSAPLRPVPRDAKLVIYVGHDTNLANIGGMLDVDWSFASGLGDKTPPAGAMAFELFNEKGTVNYFVRMTYYNQTLEQMRNATPLSPPAAPDAARANRPEVTRITPKCTNVQDGMCPWRDFDTWMRGAIENDCASLQAKPD